MTRGMMTGHQATTGIVMMTSTVAGLLWAGWPSCSGKRSLVGRMPGREGRGRESQRPVCSGFMTGGALITNWCQG